LRFCLCGGGGARNGVFATVSDPAAMKAIAALVEHDGCAAVGAHTILEGVGLDVIVVVYS